MKNTILRCITITVLGNIITGYIFCAQCSHHDKIVATALKKTPLALVKTEDGQEYPLLIKVLQYYGLHTIGYKTINVFKEIQQALPNGNGDESPPHATFGMIRCHFAHKPFFGDAWFTWIFPKGYTFNVIEFRQANEQASGNDYAHSLCGNARLKVAFDSKNRNTISIWLEQRTLSDQQYEQQCNALLQPHNASSTTSSTNCVTL